jgi:hypothetical protein
LTIIIAQRRIQLQLQNLHFALEKSHCEGLRCHGTANASPWLHISRATAFFAKLFASRDKCRAT